MPHCCGPKKKAKKEVSRSQVKEKDSPESLHQKLLRSLGLKNKDK